MRRLIFLTACLFFPAVTADAASFDCAKASTAIEKTICGDPALSTADERLAEAFASAMAVTLSPGALRAEQRWWLAERDRLTRTDALRQAYRLRIDALAAVPDKWRAVAKEVSAESAQRSCLVPPGAPDNTPCRVEEFGAVAGSGNALRYQLQSYNDGDLQIAGGVVVFRATAGRLAPVVAAAEETAHFAAPAIVQAPSAKLLVIPGHLEGTAVISAELVYLFDDGRLGEVDTESWQGELQRRVPKGWGAWKGIYPTYDRLTAETPFWQNGDANCCPTAGRAFVRLGLKDRRLVIVDLRIEGGAAAARGEP